MKLAQISILTLFLFAAIIQIGCTTDPTAYSKAAEAWKKLKKEHNNSYEFSINFVSFTGYRNETRITVKEGKIVKRSYEESFTDELPIGYEIEKWEETGDEIGKHEKGKKPITMDDVYEFAKSCSNMKTDKRGRQVEVFFELNKEGIITTTGYVPNGCMDDCFHGYHINNFTWL